MLPERFFSKCFVVVWLLVVLYYTIMHGFAAGFYAFAGIGVPVTIWLLIWDAVKPQPPTPMQVVILEDQTHPDPTRPDAEKDEPVIVIPSSHYRRHAKKNRRPHGRR